MTWKVPLFDTDFDERELEAVRKVIKSGWLTMGEVTKEFERQFAAFQRVRHAIAVTNCTTALHLAHIALGIKPNDEVICPSLSFVATANSTRYTHAQPVFADVISLDNWNIDVDTIKEVKSEKTKAITVVHYGGNPCNMPEICDYAKAEGLKIIEDCAHAPGAHIQGIKMGCWGDIGCFSFFSNKNMSTGEGGMLTTDNDELAEKIRLMRSHGMTTLTLDRHKGHSFKYDVIMTGYNYRPTEISAALGLIQLEKLERNNERRRSLVKYYIKRIKHMRNIKIPFKENVHNSSCHIFPILLNHNISRDTVMLKLKEDGIQTSIHYRPIHTFTSFSTEKPLSPLTNTNAIGNHTITLPLFPKMKESDVDFVVDALNKAIELSR